MCPCFVPVGRIDVGEFHTADLDRADYRAGDGLVPFDLDMLPFEVAWCDFTLGDSTCSYKIDDLVTVDTGCHEGLAGDTDGRWIGRGFHHVRERMSDGAAE